MTVDEMYLENIDEFINDENKIVTFKWLSQTLQVHCNIAKQMLFKFIDIQKKSKEKKGLTVTYFVAGVSKPDSEGQQAFKCAVVPEEKLDSYKKTFVTLTSCHVYSVQKCQLKDSNALYMTDYEKFKENVFESSKYSSIQNKDAQLRSQDEMDLLTLTPITNVDTAKPGTTATGSSGPGKVGGAKKQPQPALVSMFAKADANKKTEKAGADKSSKPTAGKEAEKKGKEEEPKVSAKTDNKKAKGVMNFFSKAAGQKKDAQGTKTASVEVKKEKISPAKPVSPATKKGATTKKTLRDEDSDDDGNIGRSKRRRIKKDILDSSDEEEDMDDEPIPPTPPPKEPSPEPVTKEDSPQKEVEEDPLPTKSPETKESGKSETSSGKKRRRKRKLVSKTYMDDDGFMVTNKVWESESTDASEAEEPPKKGTVKPKAVPEKGKGAKKASPVKKSPDKKGSGKQTSLMSFFKKK